MRRSMKTFAVYVLLLIGTLFVIPLCGVASADAEAGAMATGMLFPLAGVTVYGRKLFDWEGIKGIAEGERKDAVIGRINAVMKELRDLPIRKMTGADPAFSGIAPVPLIMSDTVKSPDRGYELIFDEVDMRQSTSRTFDIMSVTGGVTFYQQEEGEEAKLSKLPTGVKAPVGMLRFTGGFPILDDWLRFNEYYKIDELTSDTILRWWGKKATLMYGLLTAMSSAINQAFVTDDATTINNACAQIITDLDAAGYEVSEGAQFVIAANPVLKSRIEKALAQSFLNPNANINKIVFPISGVIMTPKLVSTSYYVCLPGFKAKRGEWEDLNTRPPQRNELKLGADHIWTGAYNAAIGEVKQFRRCALS